MGRKIRKRGEVVRPVRGKERGEGKGREYRGKRIFTDKFLQPLHSFTHTYVCMCANMCMCIHTHNVQNNMLIDLMKNHMHNMQKFVVVSYLRVC